MTPTAPATRPVAVTRHALERYRERFGPIEEAALAELCRDAALATPEQLPRLTTNAALVADPLRHYRVRGRVAFAVRRNGRDYVLLTVFPVRA